MLYINKEEEFEIALAKLGRTKLLFLAAEASKQTIRDRGGAALGDKEIKIKNKVYLDTFSYVLPYSPFILLDAVYRIMIALVKNPTDHAFCPYHHRHLELMYSYPNQWLHNVH
jgi:hypothetical protein